MEQVGAVELLAVCLAHGDDIFPSFEDLNLVNNVSNIMLCKMYNYFNKVDTTYRCEALKEVTSLKVKY